MQTVSKLEIHFRKRKVIRIIILSLLFVVAGIWLIYDPPQDINPIHGNPKVIGYISIVFFGILAIYSFSRMLDKSPAIIIDSLGLVDRSSLFPAGFILWQDLKAVSITKIKKQTFIMLELKYPGTYIEGQTGIFRRHILKTNYKLYGSPLLISPNTLEISIEELFEELKKRIPKNEQT